MVLNSKKYIPEVYSRERDMQVFTTLIDMLLTTSKYDIDSLYKLYDASICPQQFLPELANTLNYKYDFANTVTSNRKILDIFMTMMKYKGSETGLLMATALCLTSLDLSTKKLETANVDVDYITALSSLDIKYDYEKAEIQIDYPNVYTQVRYLLDYVRPVGMTVNLRSVIKNRSAIPMAILAQVSAKVREYNVAKSYVNKAKVNFSYPVEQNQLDNWEQVIQDLEQYTDDNNTINLNG
jgi:phage tail-like protein